MCGIAGFAGLFEQDLLMKMNAQLAHRGPDDAGTKFFQESHHAVGLAHRRLSIIDLSAEGHQPMTVKCAICENGTNKIWLIYNGELYNYRELRLELTARGHHFTSLTDSEVLLHMYAEYGPEMLVRLNGIFAFAIYDGRSKNGELFLARDGLGVKPLYYSQTGAGFIFASEIKALLCDKKISRSLDLTALHYYLAYLWCPGDQTALQNIKKVQPGEALIVRAGKITKRWFFYDVPYQGHYHKQSEREIRRELDRLLEQAVERQLMSDVPVGAFLSGGLDSSAIVAYMRRLQPKQDIHCYSIGFKSGMASEGNPDDIPYARAVAKHLGVKLHVMEMQPDIINNLQHMIYHLDEPQADPAPLHIYSIAQAAKRDGIKVLLSGAGGDDIFSGYRRHQAVHLERYWRWLPMRARRQVAAYANGVLDGKQKYNLQHPTTRRLAKLFSPLDLSMDKRLIHHFLWGTESLRRNLYSPELAEHVSSNDTALPLVNTLLRIPAEHEPLNRMLYLETKHFLADHNLNYTDKMAMAAGVEVRVPLLDADLVAYAAKIPVRYKQKNRLSKAIFKKTMEPYLPKKVIYRPKAGFGAPIRSWLHNDLEPVVNELLSPNAIKQRGLFNPTAISELIKADHAAQVDGAYTIFSLLCIEMWCRTFL